MTGRQALKDPMLHAAAEVIESEDHMRWLSYADAELHRLREQLNLPTPASYARGVPDYSTGVSPRARQMVAEVEARCGGRLRPNDRRAIGQMLDGIMAEAGV